MLRHAQRLLTEDSSNQIEISRDLPQSRSQRMTQAVHGEPWFDESLCFETADKLAEGRIETTLRPRAAFRRD